MLTVAKKFPSKPELLKEAEEAWKILNRMERIPKRDMMEAGSYVSEESVNSTLAKAGALCKGHKACAIGSLYLAGGVELRVTGTHHDLWGARETYKTFDLPGVDQGATRNSFLARRPALRLAYEALNVASLAYAEDKPGLAERMRTGHASAPVEALFESGFYRGRVLNREMIVVIRSAKRLLRRL